MSRSVWKWVLEAETEEAIGSYLKATNAKIDGFRSKTTKSKIPRAIITQALLEKQPLTKLKKHYYEHTQTCEKCQKYLQSDKEKLLFLIRDSSRTLEIFKALLGSSDDKHEIILNEIFETLSQQGELEILSQNIKHNQDCEKELNKLQESVAEYETKLEEHEKQLLEIKDKVKLLNQEISKSKSEIALLKEQNKKDKTFYERTIAELQAQLKESERTLEKHKSDSSELAKENDALKKQLSDCQVINIALVGNGCRISTKILNVVPLDIRNLPSNFEEQLLEIDQVWLLKYETPLSLQRKVTKTISAAKLRVFDSKDELDEYVRGGLIV